MDWVLVSGLEGWLADPTLQDGALQSDVDARETNAQAPSSVATAEEEKTAYYGPDVPLGFTPVAHDTFTAAGAVPLLQMVAAMGAAAGGTAGAAAGARLGVRTGARA